MAPACGRLFNQNNLGMEVIGERNGKKQKNQPASNCRVFLQRIANSAALLTHPSHTPNGQNP
jgi:hypothetical protein